MRHPLTAFFVTVLLLLGLSRSGLAADGPGTVTVRRANTTLASLLEKRAPSGSDEEKRLAADVTAKLRGFLDVEELGRRAMIDHWERLTPEQRAEFTGVLRGIVEASYVRALRGQLHYDVRYLGEKAVDGGLVVTTEVHTKKGERGRTLGVDYVLRRDGETWRAVDVVTDGVGLVENYRAQFNRVLAKEGFDGLIARMKAKRDKAQGLR